MTAAPTPESDGVSIRRATAADGPAVAEVYLASFHATYSFPLAHTDDQVRAWLAGIVGGGAETWVADAAGQVVAMMVLDDAGIDQLYVAPDRVGQGIGSRLVASAKAERPGALQLYTFQVNHRARRFYERHGFVAMWFGDGSENEERQPDVRYEWRP